MATQPDSSIFIQLTADIVAAHVSNNSVAVGDLPNLIGQVHTALCGTILPAVEAPVDLTPAVSVRASIKPDAIICLECGAKNKIIKKHLFTSHGLTPDQYRQKWGLPRDYPMIAPNYSEQRRALAVKIGLGRNPEATKRRLKTIGAKATGRGGRAAAQ